MADSKKYRDQAERLRREADGMTDPVERRLTRKLAELYDSLAGHIEKRSGDSDES
jgi:hypothetical protein